MDRWNKFSDRLQTVAYWVLRVVGVCIFFPLIYYSLRYSQYMLPGMAEISKERRDVLWHHLLALVLVAVAVLLLKRAGNRLSQRARLWIERLFLIFSALWAVGWGFWWINGVDRIPEGDQAIVYGAASYFLEGDFSFLSGTTAHLGMYPHQLGLISLIELLFLVVGTYNYFACEVISVFFAAGITCLGYLLLKELKAPFEFRILYFPLIMNCIPLICYTSWVYGDIPSIFFTMLATYCMIRYENCRKWYFLLGMTAAVTMAMLVRKNSMIFIVALCILSVLYVIKKRDWKVLAAMFLAIAIPFLSYQGIYKIYEIQSGYRHIKGFSINSWIAMGTQENQGMCGWYNNMPKDVLYSLSGDLDATRDAMNDILRERFTVFRQDPGYAVEFYKKKILSQWNAPLYESIFFSTHYLGEDKPAPGSLLDRIYQGEESFFRLFAVADSMQFLIYLGILFYFIFAVRKESPIMEYLLPVTLIGGFFFSILWEAKARYILVYYITMYPLAVIGYYRMLESVGRFWLTWKKRRHP